jgi:cytochrome b subunit of formate dehydrogenase/nitrate/TMAO reductase-like tetraheme cytochrome c subunit
MLPVSDSRAPVFLDNQVGTCGACHEEQTLELRKGAHAHAGSEDASGSAAVLSCAKCHGGDAHGMLPVSDSRSPVSLDKQFETCGDCHEEQMLGLRKGAHAHAGSKDASGSAAVLGCASCHGGKAHGMLPVRDSRSPVALDNQVGTCGDCHKEQMLELRKGVHAHAGSKAADGSGMALSCTACHGGKAHDILPVRDSRAAVFLDNQVRTCGDCHEKYLATYQETVHGKGLSESGLTVVAVCADCHGDHGIYYAADRRSALHPSNVAKTCGECHRFVEERLEKSVHGSAHVRAKVVDKGSSVAAQKWRRPASCSDCHKGHQLLDPRLTPFRLQLANRCGNCHPDRSSRYGMSLHGQLTNLGYGPAAECADCHGAHDIVPISDPKSPLAAGANRLATCRQCHPHAVQDFTDFDPHANCKDAASYPLLHNVTHWLRVLFFAFFGFFAIHSFLWFVRSLIHALQRGRHETLTAGQFVVMRSEPVDRFLYATLLVCFLGLILTALPLKFNNQAWAEALARNLGGFRSTSMWHHFFAAVAMLGCAVHIVRGLRRVTEQRGQEVAWKTILFGPDSRVPTLRDLKDLFGMGRWFLGLGPRPGFERWTYWEKFNYWAVYLTAAVIGISGLMLWYPNLFCIVLPGAALNVAKAVHSEVAVLAASFLFLFHFYNTHFRPEKFPMDLSALTGMVSESHLRKYRPEYVERLQREGKLDEMRRPAPSQRRLWLVFLAGAMVLTMGVGLLIVVLVATLEK